MAGPAIDVFLSLEVNWEATQADQVDCSVQPERAEISVALMGAPSVVAAAVPLAAQRQRKKLRRLGSQIGPLLGGRAQTGSNRRPD